MAQKHLYGPNYVELMPPLEWESLTVKSTTNDDSVQANVNTSVFTFVGSTATFIKEWVDNFGVFNGMPYRIVVDDQEIVFDGFLVLSEYVINSKSNPTIYEVPLRDLTDNLTAFDRVSIFTHTLLRKQNFITPSMYVHVPVVQVSKKSLNDRIVAMTNLVFNVTSTFFQIIQDTLSALSDMIGLSVVLGVVEFATLMLNVYTQIQQLVDLITKHKDLLLASQTWYNGIGIKDVVEAAFAKLNKTVDWGSIEDEISELFVLGSNNGFPGLPFPNSVQPGILKISDWGYLITETLQEIQKIYNTRQDDRGDVVWIKPKSDPDWTNSPDYEPENVVIETTEQYQNGRFRNKTEEVKATVRIRYTFDPADAWTLTENNGDAYEIHRELINELNPRMNTLKGLEDVKINWAMAVRYDPTELIIDLLQQVVGDFNGLLPAVQGILNQYAQYIDPGSNAQQDTANVLALNPLNFFFALTAGGLKVEDDTWSVPKLIRAKKFSDNTLNIQADFKDKIGAEYIYNSFYLPESPADVNNFGGQYEEANDLSIPFSRLNFVQTKNNPYFLFADQGAKLLHSNWAEDEKKTTVDFEIQKTFDNNITETVIN